MTKMTYEDARAEVIRLLLPFKPDHPRVSVFVGFEVEPAVFSDCPHWDTPEEALEEAEREDAYARTQAG